MKFAIILCFGLLLDAPGATVLRKGKPKFPARFVARAYAIDGITKSGAMTRENHTVAADPNVLPLGSEILVRGAGRYSGRYKVTDTGAEIKGTEIDIFVGSEEEAKQFGKREVRVKVLKAGQVGP